jgi:hypothetical protein
MKLSSTSIGTLVVASAVLGCADAKTSGPAMDLVVAPLDQPGLAFACYDFLIENGGEGELGVIGGLNDVLFRGDPTRKKTGGDTKTLCSDRFGNGAGGDVRYVAPCDASSDSDPEKAGVQNAVTLWIDGLYQGTPEEPVAIEDGPEGQWWKNPCGDEGCRVSFNCVEDRDTRVEFNFTIVRQADRGFFDIGVSFESVFCASKVDCRYEDGRWNRLVRDLEGVPVLTAVFGFTCTDGSPGNDTHLYVSNIEATCSDPDGIETKIEIPIDKPLAVYGPDNFPAEEWLAQAHIFQGEEVAADGSKDSDQLYWNAAIGFVETPESTTEEPRLLGRFCSLRVWATATKGSIDENLSEANVTFPYLMADVDISDIDGKVVCEQYPVDSWDEDNDNGLGSFYTAVGEPLPVDVGPRWWEMSQPADGELLVAPYGQSGP